MCLDSGVILPLSDSYLSVLFIYQTFMNNVYKQSGLLPKCLVALRSQHIAKHAADGRVLCARVSTARAQRRVRIAHLIIASI